MIPDWVIGVILSLSGCTLSNVGVNLQKVGHRGFELDDEAGVFSSPTWMFGLSLVVIGSITDFVAFAFAEVSLLAPLGAMTLVINMFTAPCFNDETLQRKDIVDTSIIIIGSVICITFGNKDTHHYSRDELIGLYGEPTFIAYAVLLAIGLAYVFSRLRDIHGKLSVGISNRSDIRFQTFAFPALGGLVGAHSVLFAKSVAEIVKSISQGKSGFTNPFMYIIICSLFASLITQVRLLNMGLARAEALYVVPVYQVTWVMMNTLVSMLYFQDYNTMTPSHLVGFFVGVFVTLVGVYRLSYRELPFVIRMPKDLEHADDPLGVLYDDDEPFLQAGGDGDGDDGGGDGGGDIQLDVSHAYVSGGGAMHSTSGVPRIQKYLTSSSASASASACALGGKSSSKTAWESHLADDTYSDDEETTEACPAFDGLSQLMSTTEREEESRLAKLRGKAPVVGGGVVGQGGSGGSGGGGGSDSGSGSGSAISKHMRRRSNRKRQSSSGSQVVPSSSPLTTGPLLTPLHGLHEIVRRNTKHIDKYVPIPTLSADTSAGRARNANANTNTNTNTSTGTGAGAGVGAPFSDSNLGDELKQGNVGLGFETDVDTDAYPDAGFTVHSIHGHARVHSVDNGLGRVGGAVAAGATVTASAVSAVGDVSNHIPIRLRENDEDTDNV